MYTFFIRDITNPRRSVSLEVFTVPAWYSFILFFIVAVDFLLRLIVYIIQNIY
jgi:hypothetical protein